MMRLIVILAILSSSIGVPVWARGGNDLTIVIEHVGVSDHLIVPVVVSTSNVGAERGRARILEGTHINMISTHVLTTAAVSKLLSMVLATHTDETKRLKESGALRFSVLHSASTQQMQIELGRANAVQLLHSLESSCTDESLRIALKYLQYQVKVAGPQLTTSH